MNHKQHKMNQKPSSGPAGLRQGNRRLAPLALALTAMLAGNVQADELDTLQFRVGESLQRDSNVFRLSDNVNPLGLVGRNERADTIAVTTLGAKFNKAYGLQRVELDAEAQNYNYQRFSRLNFTAMNYAAAWRWSLTPALHGNVTTDRREYLDKTADVQNAGAVNQRIDRSSLVDAEYEIGARWRAVGGFFDRSSRNSQPTTFFLDSTIKGAEAGARYVFREGDSVAYRFRSGRGNYLNQPTGLTTVRNFDDREHEVRLDWQLTGKNSVQARMSRLERTHDGLAARNFSGYLGEVNTNWLFTGKTSMSVGLLKDLGSYQTNNESYYDGYRLYVQPVYRATEKISARLRYEHGARNFKGALPGFAPSNRRDNLRFAALSLEYQALRSLTLAASLQRDLRTSNTPGFDYKSNSVLVSALFRF